MEINAGESTCSNNDVESSSVRLAAQGKGKTKDASAFKEPGTPERSRSRRSQSRTPSASRRITRSSSSSSGGSIPCLSPTRNKLKKQGPTILDSPRPASTRRTRSKDKGAKQAVVGLPEEKTHRRSTSRESRSRSSSSFDAGSETSSDAASIPPSPRAKKTKKTRSKKLVGSAGLSPPADLEYLDELLERARNLPKENPPVKKKRIRLTKEEREAKTARTHQLLEGLLKKAPTSRSKKRKLKGNILNDSMVSSFSSTCYDSSQISNSPSTPSTSNNVQETLLKSRVMIEEKVYEFVGDIPSEFIKFAKPDTTDNNSSIISLHRVKDFKLSEFCTKYGNYFGHKLVDGEKRKRSIRRVGYETEDSISPCFLILCTLCKRDVLKSCSNGGYDNFIRHLKVVHSLIDPSTLNLGVLTITDAGLIDYGSFETYKWSDKRQQTILQLLLQYIIDGNHPFSDVERFSFRRLINFLDPRATLPSKDTIRNMLSSLVETKVVPDMEQVLEKASCATLIADCWSSKANKGVLGVRLCFIDEEFKGRMLTIAVEELHQAHTSAYLSSVINDMIIRKKLQNKIKHVISDSGRNIMKALHDLHDIEFLLHKEIPEDEDVGLNPLSSSSPENFRLDLCSVDDQILATEVLLEDGLGGAIEINLQHEFYLNDMFKPSPCVAHILQLVLLDGMEDPQAKGVDKTIRRLSAFCRNRQMIRKMMKAIEGRVLTQPVITRWNSVVDCGELLYEESMYDTMKALLEVSHNICTGTLKETLPALLDDSFRDILGEFLSICKPICTLTDNLQGDGITGHRVIPGIAEAHDKLTALNNLVYLEDFRSKILQSFVTRMMPFVSDQDYILATVLAPNYKLWFFEIYHKTHQTTESNPLQIPTKNDVKELALVFLQAEEEKNPQFRRDPQSNNLQQQSTACSYSQLIQQQCIQEQQAGDVGESDLIIYLGMSYSSESPEQFWAKNKSKLPRLFEISRAVNCKIATSGPVERLFSLIADVNKCDRALMSIKTIEETIFCKEWFNLPKTFKEALSRSAPTSCELQEFNSSVNPYIRSATTLVNPTSKSKNPPTPISHVQAQSPN